MCRWGEIGPSGREGSVVILTLKEGEIIWTPVDRSEREAEIHRFSDQLAAEKGLEISDYDELWHFSVERREEFWDYVWRYFSIVGDRPELLAKADGKIDDSNSALVIEGTNVEDARFFPGSQINFAENALDKFSGDAKIISISESTEPAVRMLGPEDLRIQVARVADGLKSLGVTQGDRVAAYLPNSEEALVGLLASASIGAIWSCCSVDFGVTAVVDRFSQIEPKVMIAISAYRYGDKEVDRSQALADIVASLPTLQAVVKVDYLSGLESVSLDGVDNYAWNSFGDPGAPLSFTRVEFSSPLWILYSSGTTGLPKAIVHSHGGITLELIKNLAIQHDLGPGKRFFWYATTGWMMWNYLVGGLLVSCDIVLYDGNPSFPDMGVLWELADKFGITTFGISAPFVSGCIKSGLDVSSRFELSKLEAVGSTGAPLSLDGFAWLVDQLPKGTQIVSASGGTDVCTAFLASSPMTPTYAGKLSARTLGSDIRAYSSDGLPLIGEVGELVLASPLPSMPKMFWADPTGSKLHGAYFDSYPGIWRHGDWIRIDQDGSSVIFGRSDSTLNRDGVRMGTSEFYRVLEANPAVLDSLVIDTSSLDSAGELVGFVVLVGNKVLDDELVSELKSAIRRELSPRHVPNRFIQVKEIPRTLNGKKLEVPIRRLLLGEELSKVASMGSLANPDSLMEVYEAARRGRS
ncbi:MAG: acetoacetate--CoA ligase [Acidimicrobiaceae bacterium]|nr:acetoacetate--CoA ligase [Acidimicrobiaceae bacterium]